MGAELRRLLRAPMDRCTTLGVLLRRARRRVDRGRRLPSRVGNIAMLHAGRCGSSVVADLLDQHPDVYWRGELFERMSPFYYRLDPARRAEELIANELHRVTTPWYGFDSKYLPEQHLRPELANHSIESYVGLLQRLGFRHFILLWRRNHLRRAASVAIGTKTGQWNTLGEVRRETSRIEIDRFVSYGTEMPLLRYFENLDLMHERARRALGGLNVLELEYEADVERDPRVAYRKACDWLGIEALPVEVRLRRLNPQPLRELVENFDEVEAALRETRHSWMLREA